MTGQDFIASLNGEENHSPRFGKALLTERQPEVGEKVTTMSASGKQLPSRGFDCILDWDDIYDVNGFKPFKTLSDGIRESIINGAEAL